MLFKQFHTRIFCRLFYRIIVLLVPGLLFVFTIQAQKVVDPPVTVSLPGVFNNQYDSLFLHTRARQLIKPGPTVSTSARTTAVNNNCNTSTFYIRIKTTSGEKIELKEIQTLPDGNFVLVGNIILSGGEKKGVLYLLSNSGGLLQQKYIQVNNVPFSLEQVRVKLNGDIVLAGISTDVVKKPALLSLKSDLTVNWTRVFETTAEVKKLTLDFNTEDRIMLGVQQATSVVFTMLNGNGSLFWQKEIAPAGLTSLVAFTSTLFTSSILVINCENAGKKSVLLTEVQTLTGNTIRSYTMGNGVDEYFVHDVNSFNGRVLTLGVVKNTTDPFRVIRNIIPGPNEVETEHQYTIPSFIPSFTTTAAFDNAGDAVAISDAAAGKLIFIKHFTYYRTTPEHVQKYSIPTGAEVKAVARSFTDGGFLMGLNTASFGEVVLIKTDSIGKLGGCSYETISIVSDEKMFIANTANPVATATTSFPLQNAGMQLADVQLAMQADCNQSYCPPEPTADTCLASYLKTYRSNSYADGIGTSFLMRNNKIIAATGRNERILGNSSQTDFGLKRFSENGLFEKGVTAYCNGLSIPPFSIIQYDSAHLILCYSSYEVNNKLRLTFSKMNDELQIIWTATYEAFDGYAFSASGSTGQVTTDKEGNLYFTSQSAGFMENPKAIVIKIDRNGVQQWGRVYDVPNMYFLMGNAVATDTRLVMVIEGGTKGATTMSIDKNTGELKNIFTYQNNSGGQMYKRVLEYEHGKIFYAGNNNNGHLVLAVFDTTGKPLHLKYSTQDMSGIRAGTYRNGKLYGLYNFYNGSKIRNALFVTDTSLTPILYNENDRSIGYYPSAINVAENGNMYVSGSYTHGGMHGSYYDGFLQKLEPDGKLGVCAADNPVMPLQNLSYTVTPLQATTASAQMLPIAAYAIDLIADMNGQRVGQILCKSEPICTKVELSGKAKVCRLDQTETYLAERSIGCNLRAQFQYDSSFVKIQSSTDSSITVNYKKPGTTWLKVKLDAGCSIFLDSLQIEISGSAETIFLGTDTTICPGDSLLLKAPVNYQSYKWQDQSTAASLLVTTAGKYFVTATDYCGDTITDTVIVNMAVVPALLLGNDTSACMKDTLSFTAATGFNSYSWKGIGLVSTQGQTIKLIVSQNTALSVEAVTQEGCIALDTLQIQPLTARAFSLGNDTSFCNGGSTTLSVNNIYQNYLWSDGSNSTSISVSTKGNYWLVATDTNGCKAADTMQVKNVFALPVPNLGADFNLCVGDSKELDAGNYQSYLWSNGLDSRTVTVTTPNEYWVTVTDINGCTGADTVVFQSVLPLPADFLPATDSICSYDKLTIEPSQPFVSYMWSTGETKQTITILSPGSYFLTVKNNDGCFGKDTIRIIQKNCITGIHFPNAFTPNNDRLNDLYKPIIGGILLSYRLDIFNRYGQLVFSTTDPTKGWDGLFNGIPQPPSVFSWQCFYELEGDKPSHKKGLVTLIR